MTGVDIVRRVAKDYGRYVTDEEAEFILWEHTGWPCFFEGRWFRTLLGQLRVFFEEV